MSYQNPRLTLNEALGDAIVKMSEGNPGAVNVLMQLYLHGHEIDPDNLLGGPGVIFALDTNDIYGSDIWVLYKDVCDSDLTIVCALLRAIQLGFMAKGELLAAIATEGMPDSDRRDALIKQVKERLPNFGSGSAKEQQ